MSILNRFRVVEGNTKKIIANQVRFNDDIYGIWDERRITTSLWDDLLESDEYFYYGLRHGDNGDWATPVTIEQRVIVNYCGYLITNKELDFKNSNFIAIEKIVFEDELFANGELFLELDEKDNLVFKSIAK